MRALRLPVLIAIVVAAAAVLSVTLWRRLRPPVRPATPPASLASLPDLAVLPWVNGAPGSPDSTASATALVMFADTDPHAPTVLRAAEGWHEAYGGFGVRVLGVHAPQFAFAADTAVTARLARRAGARFPIALDPSLSVASVLGPVADGPRIVVFDGRGAALVNRAGPDAPAEAERALRAALARGREAGEFPRDPGTSFALAMPRARTIHLGAGRVAEGPLATVEPGRLQVFTAQFRHQIEGERDVPYPVGRWIPEGDGLRAGAAGAANFVAIRYDAARVWVVASPPASGSARLWILLDERWLDPQTLGADARIDAAGASYIEVDEPRLYTVTLAGGRHVLKLSPDVAGLTLHAVTFESDARHARP
jgi:hypothetical protein